MTLTTIGIIAAALGSAMIAGLFFAFSAFIMRALGERPSAEGVAAMVSINRVILRSLFIPLFFGTALLALGLAVYGLMVWTPVSPWLLAGAAAYLVGSIGVTMIWNVPLNNALDRAEPEADNQPIWSRYLREWVAWNHVRTVASLLSAAAFIGALLR